MPKNKEPNFRIDVSGFKKFAEEAARVQKVFDLLNATTMKEAIADLKNMREAQQIARGETGAESDSLLEETQEEAIRAIDFSSTQDYLIARGFLFAEDLNGYLGTFEVQVTCSDIESSGYTGIVLQALKRKGYRYILRAHSYFNTMPVLIEADDVAKYSTPHEMERFLACTQVGGHDIPITLRSVE